MLAHFGIYACLKGRVPKSPRGIEEISPSPKDLVSPALLYIHLTALIRNSSFYAINFILYVIILLSERTFENPYFVDPLEWIVESLAIPS